MHLLRTLKLDSSSRLSKHFMPHQIQWIQAEKAIHQQGKQAIAFAEKSVRIGWTYADAFKNVRKRLWFKDRDYLFATKDYPSALEYVRQCYKFAEIFNLTRTILSHDEEYMAVNQLDAEGRPSGVVEQVKVGVIKFDNGSRIMAFSSNPQAMAVYGGDVGLDEFAKHPNAKLLWETAQGRIALGHDLAIWSAHDGEDTLFNEFAQEARAACTSGLLVPAGPGCWRLPDPSSSSPTSTDPVIHQSTNPWNLYFRVTMPDAINLGLVNVINRTRGANLSPEQFLADCRSRARQDEIFEQSYMCNPLGAATNHIVDWSAIERCRYDYEIERVHLEAADVTRHFGEFSPSRQDARESQIESFLHQNFPDLLGASPGSSIKNQKSKIKNLRLGFDVAASGQGDLAAFYIDEPNGSELTLRALLTVRTEDWNFLKTVLFYFLRHLNSVQGAGDESGLGRQICWEAAKEFSSRFLKVNFAAKKHDLGFALMNQLSTAEKRFPKCQQDIAADYFALRKSHSGAKWVFSEGRNTLNPNSHCDIAWAGALATHAHIEHRNKRREVYAAVVHEDGWSDHNGFHPFKS
jgi:phage FluMu gp28-like protein